LISDARPAQNAENGSLTVSRQAATLPRALLMSSFAVVILQQLLSWTLDDLEAAEALADEGLVEAE
tara:strand:+ start:203 stop:400 length:198 start_codon:yes stop_codon:yes gene_type:complete